MAKEKLYITSPKTGRSILVGGPTYTKLLQSAKWAPLLGSKHATKSPKTKSHGCSNKGKYPRVAAKDFCGPSGGSCPGTFPVNTRGRARAALAYARYAPEPEGIKECVRKHARAKGWIDPRTGKLRM